MAEQNLGSWFWHMSPPSLQIASLLIKANFSFYQHLALHYWLLSGEQLNMSLVTLLNKKNTIHFKNINSRIFLFYKNGRYMKHYNLESYEVSTHKLLIATDKNFFKEFVHYSPKPLKMHMLCNPMISNLEKHHRKLKGDVYSF